MPNRNPFQLSGWKIFLPIFIGIGISVFLLYRAFNTVTFVQVESKTGSYSWVDANKNGRVDIHEPSEFISVPRGNYDQETFTSALEQISWSWKVGVGLFLAALFMIGRDFFYMVRIRVLTHDQLNWKQAFYVILLWEFASALSPGIVGGAAVAMFILRKEGIALGRSTAIVVITAFLDNLFYLLLIPIVFLFVENSQLFPQEDSFSGSSQTLFWSGIGIIFLVCTLLYLSIFQFPQLFGQLLNWVVKIPFLKKWKASAIQTGQDVALASKELRQEPFRFWLRAFGATFFSWISRYLVINAILWAFLDLRLMDHFLLLGKQLVLWLFLLISPTPGASGVAEFAFSELLQHWSTSVILMVTLAVIWRLFSYFPYLFIGSFLAPRWLRKK